MAYSLDLELGSSQYAGITDAAQSGVLDINSDMTIEAWVKFETIPSVATTTMAIVTKYLASQVSYYFVATSANSLQFVASADGSAETLNESVAWTPTVATWYHLAVSLKLGATNTAEVKFYVNGVQQGTTQTGSITAIHNGTAAFRVGNTDDEDLYLDGLIDEVRIWNDVRTITEIAANYQKELIGTEANLIGYWRFNGNYLDKTANANTLTGGGSPTFSSDAPFSQETAGGSLFFSQL